MHKNKKCIKIKTCIKTKNMHKKTTYFIYIFQMLFSMNLTLL